MSNLNFQIPTLNAANFLLENKNAFYNYDMALVWMQDYLQHFTPNYGQPRLSKEASFQKITEIAYKNNTGILFSNIQENQLILQELEQQYEINPSHTIRLINQFLDTMLTWQNHMVSAKRLGNLDTLSHYYLEEKTPSQSLPSIRYQPTDTDLLDDWMWGNSEINNTKLPFPPYSKNR